MTALKNKNNKNGRWMRYPKYKDSGIEWLGEVPEGWTICKIKHFVSKIGSGKTPRGGSDVYVDSGVMLLRSQNVHFGGLRLDDVVFIDLGIDAEMANTRVRPNDVLLNITGASLGRCCLVGKNVKAANVNQHVCILRANRNAMVPDYLCASLCSRLVQTQIFANENGTSREGLNFQQIGNLVIPLSQNINEQKAIANFLDRKTAQIDTLIAKKERQIELLREKRAALISHAVTKGLDPNAKMKDSGIEWLGEVPEHWALLHLGRITLSRCDGPFGSGLKSKHYSDNGGIRVIRLQNIRFAQFDDADKAFIEIEHYKSLGDHDVEPGDLLIAGLGDDNNPVGRACVAPSTIGPAMVKADCFRFRLNTEKAHTHYFAFQLSASAAALAGALSSGTTRSRMNLSTTTERSITLPPLYEQRMISKFLEESCMQVDKTIDKITNSITTLREYRTALISAAVTGKIDVRDV